jgi:hypothetical protein
MFDKLQFVDSLSLWEWVGVRAKLRTTREWVYFSALQALSLTLSQREGIKHFQPLDDN